MSSNKTQDFSYYIQYFMNLLWVKYNKTVCLCHGRNWAMAVIALGMTMAVLDGAIANVALPTIAGDLHVNPSSSIWVVNAFQLAMTISLLAFSSLGDLWGYKRVYVLGLSMFTVTSLICALSDSFITLVIARGLQGFSAAAITSVNTALLRVIFPAVFWPWNGTTG